MPISIALSFPEKQKIPTAACRGNSLVAIARTEKPAYLPFQQTPPNDPMPVLIIGTYNDNGMPNAMNAAWGGISEETQISICVDDGHKTAKNVVKTGAFTVSIADAENVVACDYVGIVSGNKEPDKIKKTGWTVLKSEFVDAPLF
ncbi:MAG: hypothetical protein IJN00_03705, partial [Clostridia bacterium]|nr:hypothetical protein [Clostridia bacterium]